MEEVIYTHAQWRVKPGREAEFIKAWKDLAKAFSNLPARPLRSTLIQSLVDESLFYSFGQWKSLSDIVAMRHTPRAREAFQKAMELCIEVTPSTYRMIADIQL
jgi:heme-degrading monooxygenase HmoA